MPQRMRGEGRKVQLAMKKTISTKQLTFAVGLIIIASNLLTKSLYPYTKNQTWISVVAAAVAGLVVVSIYGRLVKDYPGSGLFDINQAVFGTVGGKIVSAAYVFFFLSLSVLNTRDLGSFVHSIVLPSTPINVTYIAFMVICVFAVRKGADKMTQYGAFILLLYLLLLFFNTGLLVPKMHQENLLPVFTVPLKNFFLSTLNVLMLPYAEIFIFLTLAQHMQNPEKTGKALRGGLMIGAATTLFLVLRDIMVLGDYTLLTSSPTFNTIRLIDVGDILTRLEIINAVLQISLLFLKVSIMLYALTEGFGRLLNIKKSNTLALIMGALVVVCAKFFFISSSEHTAWFRTAAVYATFFLLILPLLTLITSRFRRAAAGKKPDDPIPLE